MAINLNTQYSSKNVPVSTNYPYGQGMNVSAQGAGDAVPWEAAVFNDWNGYFQAVLSAASIVPSGTPDNAVTSQYLQALRALFLDASNNLSDLTNVSTARTNLGVSSTVEADARYLNESSNLSDLPSVSTARTNLGVYSTSATYTRIESDARFLNESNNLSDLTNTITAQSNLGLGTVARLNTGTGSNNVPTTAQADARYLNDDRFRWASQISFSSGIAVPTSAVGVYFWFNSIEDRTGIINQVVSGSTIEIFRYRTGSGGDIVSSFSLLAAGSSTLTRSNTGSAFLRWIYRS